MSLGNIQPILITTSSSHTPYVFSTVNWQKTHFNSNLVTSLGIYPNTPDIPPLIAKVTRNSPAELAGLKPGDMITAFNNQPIQQWSELLHQIQTRPNQNIQISKYP